MFSCWFPCGLTCVLLSFVYVLLPLRDFLEIPSFEFNFWAARLAVVVPSFLPSVFVVVLSLSYSLNRSHPGSPVQRLV